VAKGIYLSRGSPRTCEPISVNRCRFMPKTRLSVIEMLGRHATHGDCWRYFALSQTRHRTLLRMCCHGKAVARLFGFFRRDASEASAKVRLDLSSGGMTRSATKDKCYFIRCFSREIFLSFAFFARRMARVEAARGRRLHRAISFRFVTSRCANYYRVRIC